MRPKVRQPSSRWIEILGILAALLCAVVVWGSLRRTKPQVTLRPDLFSGAILTSDYLPELEQEWIESAFPPIELVSPVGSLPCPDQLDLPSSMRSDVDAAFRSLQQGRSAQALAKLSGVRRHWLPALVVGTLKARDGSVSEAQLILQEYLNFDSVNDREKQILASSRRDEVWSVVSSDEIRGLIYIRHALASIQIAYRRPDNNLLANVRNPIGHAKQLALRGEIGDVQSMPTYSELAIPPPGCSDVAQSLTTYDLYNNLLVAYIRSPNYHHADGRGSKEFQRKYHDSPSSNPLLAVLNKARIEVIPEREHWVWAISNAERILRWSSRVPQDARLSYNLAALLDSALAVGPREVRPALVERRDVLLAAAISQRQRIADDQQQLALGNIRLQLFDASRQGRSPALTLQAEAGLTADQMATLDAVGFSIAQRQNPTMLAGAATTRGGAREALGERAPPWLGAVRSEVATTLARRAKNEEEAGSTQEVRAIVLAARELLEDGDREPPELIQLEESLAGWRHWLSRSALAGRGLLFALPLVIAAGSGFCVWLASRWLGLQLRRRESLMASFYRREAIAQRTQNRGRR